MIFPNIQVKETNKLELNKLKEIAWDFENDTPIIKDNEFVIVEGLEALRVWVYKTIKTKRFKFLAYGKSYGTSINSYIGKVFTESVKRDFKSEIIDALMVSDYIDSVTVTDYALDCNNMYINLRIHTLGNTLMVIYQGRSIR